MKEINLKLKIAFYCFSFSAFTTLFAFVFFELWLNNIISTDNAEIKSSTKIVIRSCILSKVAGAYWETELLQQSEIVDKYPKEKRISFYKDILLNCDVNGYRGVIFAEILKNDATALRMDLMTMKNAPNYQKLDEKQTKNIDDWIAELAIIETLEMAPNKKSKQMGR